MTQQKTSKLSKFRGFLLDFNPTFSYNLSGIYKKTTRGGLKMLYPAVKFKAQVNNGLAKRFNIKGDKLELIFDNNIKFSTATFYHLYVFLSKETELSLDNSSQLFT